MKETDEPTAMLQDSKAFSSFSVDDIAKARQFYAETLGLRVSEANGRPAQRHGTL